MNENNTYQNPLLDRYSSREMSEIFGLRQTVRLWRQLWVALAKGQKQLGLDIGQHQIDALVSNIDNIDFDKIKNYESKLRHDVMAGVLAYSDVATSAKPILHLGATSNFIKDNAELISFRQGLYLVKAKLLQCIDKLASFCLQYKDMPCLGWTHLQPAQLTTVGKRAAMWLHDLVYDYDKLDCCIARLRLRGVKGTTGTQASFLQLFDGDHDKVKELDKLVAKQMGFDNVYDITGQTYSRKVDYDILSVLCDIAQSSSKFATDLRLLMSIKELEEPFETQQVGSSAMAYKRNPMRCERICSLSRFVIALPANASMTASIQWLERTLDDSANRRITMPQAFLAIDGILNLYQNVVGGLVVYPNSIQKNIDRELPFMATENIIMQAVKQGGDRQQLHEAIRQHSMKAAHRIKHDGLDNDLIDRLKADKLFDKLDLDNLTQPSDYTGRASQQTQEFVQYVVRPLLDANIDVMNAVSQTNIQV